MLTLSRVIGKHPLYFTALVLFIITASVTICLDNKIDEFIKLNPVHDRGLDILFIGVTFLGDGLFSLLVACIVLLFWKDYKLAIHIVIAFIASGILAQVLKNMVLEPRPRTLIEPGLYNYFLAGVTRKGFNSFPSGHTTSVFSLATILALHAGKKGWGMFFLFIALLVGYSRIYLGQHFLPDVTAGALLGTATAILVFAFININLRKRTAAEATMEEELSSNFAGSN